MKVWSFAATITYPKDNICFQKSIFQWQIKLFPYPSEFSHLRRKSAVLFSKWQFGQKFLVISWTTISGKMHIKKMKSFSELFRTKNWKEICGLFNRPVFICKRWVVGKEDFNIDVKSRMKSEIFYPSILVLDIW